MPDAKQEATRQLPEVYRVAESLLGGPENLALVESIISEARKGEYRRIRRIYEIHCKRERACKECGVHWMTFRSFLELVRVTTDEWDAWTCNWCPELGRMVDEHINNDGAWS